MVNIHTFKIGDKVYVLNEQSHPHKSKKLTPHYSGPYEIINKDSPVNCILKIKNKKVKVHANCLKLMTNNILFQDINFNKLLYGIRKHSFQHHNIL